MSPGNRIFITEDGSHSIFVPELDETYHSKHGAIQESRHVFIKSGLKYFLDESKANSVRILEYGFGTGLNSLLTMLESTVDVTYHSLEKYPLSTDEISKLNLGKVLNAENEFAAIHTAEWEKEIAINDRFRLQKIKTDFKKYLAKDQFDIIYFDAFAPSKQPLLWTKDIFQSCYDQLLPKGIFVTYSAKGQVKRDLKSVGFSVETIPGPPGKFQMTRAIKK